MKYKRQLVGSVLAFTMMVGVSSAFAADAVATSTKMHHVKNQIKMKDDNRDGKIDKKDANGNDLEEKDGTKASSTMTHKNHKKSVGSHRDHKTKVSTTTTVMTN
jgi:hypothetical protein